MIQFPGTDVDFVGDLQMDPYPTNGAPSRDVLLDMIKAQLDDEARDQDFRRDVFLCLAVTTPQRQRVRAKDALESLLARVRNRNRGCCRDLDPGEDLQGMRDDQNIAAELERSIGVVSTLLVMGCEFTLDSQACDVLWGDSLWFPSRNYC